MVDFQSKSTSSSASILFSDEQMLKLEERMKFFFGKFNLSTTYRAKKPKTKAIVPNENNEAKGTIPVSNTLNSLLVPKSAAEVFVNFTNGLWSTFPCKGYGYLREGGSLIPSPAFSLETLDKILKPCTKVNSRVGWDIKFGCFFPETADDCSHFQTNQGLTINKVGSPWSMLRASSIGIRLHPQMKRLN